MPQDDQGARSERQQTDESLRAERERVDHALEEQLAAIDETADAVISRARSRADGLLAAARAKTDGQPQEPSGTPARKIIDKERLRADEALREERATADETLRQERAEHVGLLSVERHETDKDLLSERATSDNVLATRDAFLGVVGHELRNMLNAMIGFAAMIARDVSEDGQAERVRQHAHRIHRSGARMNRLIGDLFDVASIEAGILAVTREIGDPAHVLTEAVETFLPQAAAGHISLRAENRSPATLAAFDPARILQVITNLLSNAIKFTPRQGEIVVALERLDHEVRFSISDTGDGIPADKLEAVFSRFFQVTKHDRRGVGLGLYISKCIVEGHGGRIWAESRPGGGSTFYFTLPVHVPAA